MKKTVIVALIISMFAAFATAAELSDFKDLSGTINIAGGTAHIPVMKDAAKSVMTYNNKITVTIAGGGSGVGVKQAGEGLVEIGNTGRPLKQSEIDQYGLISYPFAIDGVAVAVNPANTVKELTGKQIQDIFTGKITNWEQLGGKKAAINVYTREDGSGTREVFADKLLLGESITPKALIVNSNGAMKTSIAKDANAIGYAGIGHVDKTIKAIVVDGAEPTQENAADGTYKVTRLLYMNTKGKPDKLTDTFIKYITESADGKKFIEDAGYIALH